MSTPRRPWWQWLVSGASLGARGVVVFVGIGVAVLGLVVLLGVVVEHRPTLVVVVARIGERVDEVAATPVRLTLGGLAFGFLVLMVLVKAAERAVTGIRRDLARIAHRLPPRPDEDDLDEDDLDDE